jgi:hypothetical protein
VKVIIAAGIAGAITLGGIAWGTPTAGAAPCFLAGAPGHHDAANQACRDCMTANGNNLQASYICGVPTATGPACEQAGVCGNGYRMYPYPENAPPARRKPASVEVFRGTPKNDAGGPFSLVVWPATPD